MTTPNPQTPASPESASPLSREEVLDVRPFLNRPMPDISFRYGDSEIETVRARHSQGETWKAAYLSAMNEIERLRDELSSLISSFDSCMDDAKRCAEWIYSGERKPSVFASISSEHMGAVCNARTALQEPNHDTE